MLSPWRARLLHGALVLWTVLVVVRLAQVQLLQHDEWQAEATEQQGQIVEVQAPRGDILTRDGRVLAGSLERMTVCANPRRVPRAQWAAVARKLSPATGLSEREINARFASAAGFLYLAKDLDPEVERTVARLGLEGVWTERTERRLYPHGEFAGPVVGFVNGEERGQAGLEGFFESTLRGAPSRYHLVRDGKSVGTPLDLSLEREGRAGISLRTALDSRIQLVVEEELGRTMAEIGARGATAVVMDPWTGELLAVVSLPAYDPARPGQIPAELRRNRAAEDALEPGSTFKPVVVAAALAAGVLTPYELVDCSGGGVQVAGVFIRDHANYGLLPVRQVLAQSSNAGTIRIAHRMGPAQLDATIRALGFGQTTGVELPAEARGIYRTTDRWSALSRAGLALGQEISASALQIARAYAAIGNGGLLVRPRLVLETIDGSTGRVVTPYVPDPDRRVLPAEVARQVAGMLQAVVDEGTGKSARVEGYHAAGKTGTAQKAGVGGYGGGMHAAWFAGFLPREHPRVVIVVCVDQPEKTFWAADVAAPAFGRIATRLVTLLGMLPLEGEQA